MVVGGVGVGVGVGGGGWGKKQPDVVVVMVDAYLDRGLDRERGKGGLRAGCTNNITCYEGQLLASKLVGTE
jgi:hypothetical protein